MAYRRTKQPSTTNVSRSKGPPTVVGSRHTSAFGVSASRNRAIRTKTTWEVGGLSIVKRRASACDDQVHRREEADIIRRTASARKYRDQGLRCAKNSVCFRRRLRLGLKQAPTRVRLKNRWRTGLKRDLRAYRCALPQAGPRHGIRLLESHHIRVPGFRHLRPVP